MAGATFSRVKTWIAEILTASDLNAEFDNILNNLLPSGIDDESVNDAAMQATADPYPGAAISKPTDLQGEIQRIRYLIKQITGEAQWYIDPDIDLSVIDLEHDADGTHGDITPTSIKMESGSVEFDVGADVASATDLLVLGDGNFFDVTGTTTIETIDGSDAATAIGVLIALQFDGALTLTHHATNLILPGGANITTAAGDIALMYKYASGDWRCISYTKTSGTPVLAGSIVQSVHTQTGAVNTGTTVLPTDDTIPQNTEGDEYMTQAITPTNASNKLLIEVVFVGGQSSNTAGLYIALFQDSTAAALASAWGGRSINIGSDGQVVLRYEMVAGTTSSTTFKIRAGAGAAGTTTFNGVGGGRSHGGVANSSIRITEYTV